MKSRGVYETPGIILLAHTERWNRSRSIAKRCLRDSLGVKFAKAFITDSGLRRSLSYCVRWLTPRKEKLSDVRLKLYRGNADGRERLTALQRALATFEADSV